MICKYCGSENAVKNGHTNGKQFYVCKSCGHKFVEPEAYPKMRTKGRVIATAIDLYFEGLSVRKVQVQLGRFFGVKISQVAIWKWIVKYSDLASHFVEKLTPHLMGVYHVDETAIRCKGVQKWFWEIIDEQTKFLVASHLSGARTTEDAVALFERSIRVAKRKPISIYCDGLPAYKDGFNRVFYTMREFAEEIDVLDDMLSALVEVLEEKGILTQEEWEKRIKTKMESNRGKVSFRDLPP
jgi:transposase-like protein